MSAKRTFLFFVAAACTALPAGAAIYQWKDASGKTIISDQPPPGQVSVEKKIETPVTAQPAQPSLADRELEFRKRRKEAQDNAEKAAKEQTAAAEREKNCQTARQQLQALESFVRIALRDEKGERFFMDDAQRQQEIERAKHILETQCQ